MRNQRAGFVSAAALGVVMFTPSISMSDSGIDEPAPTMEIDQVHEGTWPCSGQLSRGYLETNTAGGTYLRAPGGTKTSCWPTGGIRAQAATSTANSPILGGGSWRASAPTIYDSWPGCTLQ